MFRTVDRYEEDGLGLPYAVTLIDGAEEQIDDDTGKVIGISIPAMETLVAAIAVTRASIPVQLSGDEVRFIRGVIGMGSKAFAESLEMDPSTFSH
jgi:DNA-binding transcriptional regulator YiaG